MSVIWHETPDGWLLMEPIGFPDEKTLHELVAREPRVLPLSGSPQLAVLGREVGLGQGRADIVAVESTGRLVVIEVKLAYNAEARRAVVTQALAYASYLDGLTAEELERSILGRQLYAAGHRSIADAVAANDQEGAFEPDSFGTGVEDSLASGRFRIVLVLDEAPAELVRLVGYLERVTGELTIDLVTVAAYDVDGSRLIVPQRIDPERRSRTEAPGTASSSGVLSEGADAFERSIHAAPKDRDALSRLVSWARDLEREGLVRLQSYEGVSGRFTLLPRIWGEDAGLVTLWNDSGASISFWRTVFDRCAPRSLAAVEAVLEKRVGQGNTTSNVSDTLLARLTDAHREAASRRSST